MNLEREIDRQRERERKERYVALAILSSYYAWKTIKKSYRINKLKIPAPTWNEQFELHDVANSLSDIQDYFKRILKNMRQLLIILH